MSDELNNEILDEFEKEREEMRKQGKIIEFTNLLTQNDYVGRKIAFEVAEKLIELFPDISMPEYEKYKNMEAQAKIFRQEINALKQ